MNKNGKYNCGDCKCGKRQAGDPSYTVQDYEDTVKRLGEGLAALAGENYNQPAGRTEIYIDEADKLSPEIITQILRHSAEMERIRERDDRAAKMVADRINRGRAREERIMGGA